MRVEPVIIRILFNIFLPAGCTGQGKLFEVRIQDSAFYPDSITISSGDDVKRTNLDSVYLYSLRN